MDTKEMTEEMEFCLARARDMVNDLYLLWKETGYNSEELENAHERAQDLYGAIVMAILYK